MPLSTKITRSSCCSELKGVGKATLARLHGINVFTLQDLLNLDHDSEAALSIPSAIKISHLQSQARDLLSSSSSASNPPGQQWETDDHTWQGVHAHIVRKGNEVIKVIVGELVVQPCRIAVRVRWRRGKSNFHRLVSPISIVALHMLWLSCDVVSEESGDEFEQEGGAGVSMVPLPRFEVSPDWGALQQMNEAQIMALKSIIKETGRLQSAASS